MRKKSLLLIILVLAMCISPLDGCRKRDARDRITGSGAFEKIYNGSQNTADKLANLIIDTLETGNADKIREMFSQKTKDNVADLDSQIETLLDYYKGGRVSLTGDAMTSMSRSHGKIDENSFSGQYALITEKEKYYFVFNLELINAEHPEQEGLSVLEFVTNEIYQAEVDAQGYYQWQFVDLKAGRHEDSEMPGIYVRD